MDHNTLAAVPARVAPAKDADPADLPTEFNDIPMPLEPEDTGSNTGQIQILRNARRVI